MAEKKGAGRNTEKNTNEKNYDTKKSGRNEMVACLHKPNLERRTQKRKCNEIDSTGARQYNSDVRIDKNVRVNIKPLSPGTLRRFGASTEKATENVCTKQLSESEARIRKRKRNGNDSSGKREENRYMLRNKPRSSTVITEIRKRPNIEDEDSGRIAQTKPKPKRRANLQLQERLLNDVPSKEYLPNEIILATIPGYVAWPARILEMMGQTVLVEFFGTGQRNLVRPGSIRHFDVKAAIPLLNRKGYKKAMTELELCLAIPASLTVIS